MPFGHSKTTWGSKKVNNFCPPKIFHFLFFGGYKASTKRHQHGPKKKQGREFSKPYFRQGNSQKQSPNKKSPTLPPQFSQKKSQIFSNLFLRIFIKIALSAARSVFENFSQKYFLTFWGGNCPEKFSNIGVLSCFVFENSAPKK